MERDLYMDIYKCMTLTAILEQTAEECAELSQASLKLARKLRGENPTPKSLEELERALNEEAADVQVCTALLEKTGVLNRDDITELMNAKTARWAFRLGLI